MFRSNVIGEQAASQKTGIELKLRVEPRACRSV